MLHLFVMNQKNILKIFKRLEILQTAFLPLEILSGNHQTYFTHQALLMNVKNSKKLVLRLLYMMKKN